MSSFYLSVNFIILQNQNIINIWSVLSLSDPLNFFFNFSLLQPVCSPSFPPGTTLTYLQLALKFAGLAYIPAFTKIYQRTLDWFPGFVFTLSSMFTVLAMIPIRYSFFRLFKITILLCLPGVTVGQ